MRKIKVLHVLPALNFCGGIENYIMNYYRKINKNLIQFDFITHTDLENSFKDEIENLGGRVYEFPTFKIKNLNRILTLIKQFFYKNNTDYDIIHCHMANAAIFYFFYANKYNPKIIKIMHSHQPAYADRFLHSIRNYFLVKSAFYYVDSRIACSNEAGRFLFGDKSFKIIKNAIDINKFKFSYTYKDIMREKFNLKNKFVIGHVGRFSPVKNHYFLLNILEEFLKMDNSAMLCFVGNGSLKTNIILETKRRNIENHVLFFNVQKEIYKYYSMFDVFVLPSIYEGVGMVAIEAQYANIPVFVSKNRIPDDIKISNKISFLDLKLGAQKWAKEIFEQRNTNNNFNIFNRDYDIKYQVKEFENYYIKLVKGNG